MLSNMEFPWLAEVGWWDVALDEVVVKLLFDGCDAGPGGCRSILGWMLLDAAPMPIGGWLPFRVGNPGILEIPLEDGRMPITLPVIEGSGLWLSFRTLAGVAEWLMAWPSPEMLSILPASLPSMRLPLILPGMPLTIGVLPVSSRSRGADIDVEASGLKGILPW